MSGIDNCVEIVHGQLIRYITENEKSATDDTLAFLAARRSYKLLAPLAEDLTVPASQAFVERFFSVWPADSTQPQPHLQILRNASFLEAEQKLVLTVICVSRIVRLLYMITVT